MIFVPKIALAYGFFTARGADSKSDAWRVVKPGSSGSGSNNPNNHGVASGSSSKKMVKSDGAENHVSTNSTKVSFMKNLLFFTPQKSNNVKTTIEKVQPSENRVDTHFQPSVNSLMELPKQLPGYVRPNSNMAKRMSKEGVATSPTNKPKTNGLHNPQDETTNNRAVQLSVIMEDDPARRRFRRYLGTLHMDENVYFWDSVSAFLREKDAKARAIMARAIIMAFCVDNAPKMVNLSAKTREVIMNAYNSNNMEALGDVNFFAEPLKELFDDLKNSTAFMKFLDNGGATAMNLSLSGPSDISLS